VNILALVLPPILFLKVNVFSTKEIYSRLYTTPKLPMTAKAEAKRNL
jgi:hypothetical protein